MKTILLMRHSHAVSNNPAYSDHERPLSDKGRDLAHLTANLLTELQPDRIVCSSAARTLQTAEVFASTMVRHISPESFESLYLAPAEAYLQLARDKMRPQDESVLFVGHNPGIASLICSWAQDSLPISPATVAIFRVNVDDWRLLIHVSAVVPELSGMISDGVRVT